ncbi:hypothetical protein ACF8O9_10135 [Stenotrophomonas geniculata]|uniref:hypothetical protein n=1 Tax=Stenotrophomonas TaxID=40323 RepID=UPI001F2F7789|nr:MULTISPECIES: hypothetical protein [Stenotrophomonas maltophilia group]MCF3478848.1 hypothetical protein [Stenotrophomonas maltophilia]MCM2518531.1 hypothetical protein [Stenotrophomonas maltophilia]MDJ1623624.1 hypothetical protein [Stenotrophomonas sepilia]
MAKFIKPFRGVPEGEIYPVQFVAGDDCPPELEAGALSVGALSLMVDTPSPFLVGSSVQPESFELSDGSVLSLGEVVGRAHAASGLSVEDWNALEESAREALIAETVDKLSGDDDQGQVAAGDKPALIAQLEAAGIPFDKRWGAEKLAAALAEGKKD